MALATCAECGHTVSQHAKRCPSCGVDFDEGVFVESPEQLRKDSIRFWLIGGGGFFVVLFFAMMLTNSDSKPTVEQEREYRKFINEAPERQKERESKRFWDSVNR